MRPPLSITLPLVVALGTASSAHADVTTIPPSKDNTLYQNNFGTTSNGQGDYIFAGVVATGGLRRAVIAFDVAAAVPAGATIDAVTLTLNCSKVPFVAPTRTFNLHRLLADWGEGMSDALGQEGGGTASAPNDANWIHRFYDTTFWTTAGGDFSGTVSAGASLTNVGSYTWGSTAQMVADVQGWLDNPATNFGWLLKDSTETTTSSAKRFDSRDHPTPANWPALTITFTPPPKRGDFDHDDDTDVSDFLVFQACFNGPNNPPAQPDCDEADMDTDNDVDVGDFVLFQVCFNGPNNPPACP